MLVKAGKQRIGMVDHSKFHNNHHRFRYRSSPDRRNARCWSRSRGG
jgi:hypothetical protein